VHGLLAPCNDHQAAADAIIRLLEDSALAHRVAEAARETCARYQWSSVRAQWVALYRRLVRPRAVAAATTA
jgi:glycosyltransferase involved in cell wall biosynthesis